jgi:hypothetical protein
MDILHNIYILDHPMFKDNNIKFLSYIKKNQNIIKNMSVRITITPLTPDQLEDKEIEEFLRSKQIEVFPVLITDNKIYKGLHDIVNIYETNIIEYNKHVREIESQRLQQMQQMQQMQQIQQKSNLINNEQKNIPIKSEQPKRNAPIDNDEQMHSYIASQLHIKNKEEEDETVFGDGGDNIMMDSYRHMMSRRGVEKKNPFGSKMRTIENSEKKVNDNEPMNMQDIIFKQLQNKQVNNQVNKQVNNEIDMDKNPRHKQMQMIKNQMNDTEDDERDDNIKADVEEERINIDPSNIEYDGDEDPQDAILEKAYWNRVSETK